MHICAGHSDYFYAPPWKRGHIVLQLSVGRSVCRSVDQVLSDQYLLTPSLDQYQTCCKGYPQWVDDPYWFSGHMVKCQGQTSLLNRLCCPLNIFWPLSLDQYQTWCRGCPQWVDDPYWFSGHMFKGQGQTTLLGPVCCPLNIFWPPHLIKTKLGAGVGLISKWSLLIFRSHVHRSRSKYSFEPSVLFTLYILIFANLLWTGFASTEKINFILHHGGIYVSATILVYHLCQAHNSTCAKSIQEDMKFTI